MDASLRQDGHVIASFSKIGQRAIMAARREISETTDFKLIATDHYAGPQSPTVVLSHEFICRTNQTTGTKRHEEYKRGELRMSYFVL